MLTGCDCDCDEVVRSWRDPQERDEPRGGGRSHRGADGRDNSYHDRGDYHRKRFDRSYDDDDEEGGLLLLLLS